MTTFLPHATPATQWRGARAVRLAEVLLFAVLPVLALGYVFGKVLFADLDVYAVHPYTVAADAALHGHNPYPALTDPDFLRGAGYVYPPLVAILSIPLTLLPLGVAEIVMMILLVGALVVTLFALGVRDWRCYGMPFLWPPVLSAIQTGNVTLLMALAAALVWRFRDRDRASGLALGVSLAAKLYLWPLVVWLLVTRRVRAAGWSLLVALVVLVGTWAAIGFAGLTGYPELLHRLSENSDEWALSVYAVALDAGASSFVARALWLAVAVGVLALGIALARSGDRRGAFIVVVAASIAFSPIVWLHYFALLVVVVAVAEQSLGPAWFAPLLMWLTMGGAAVPAIGNGAPLQTASTLCVAALTVGLALRSSGSIPRVARSGGLTARS
jgi:alpha-1,2-mannosyltransferase